MNGPFVVAQANTGGASATPVQVLKLIKPKAGETGHAHAALRPKRQNRRWHAGLACCA